MKLFQFHGESTVEAKMGFEHDYGVKVAHYYADNGPFDTSALKAAITKAKQMLSLCGVNAHHQNGKAENWIKDVMQGARTVLLHAAHWWPKAVAPSLWPELTFATFVFSSYSFHSWRKARLT